MEKQSVQFAASTALYTSTRCVRSRLAAGSTLFMCCRPCQAKAGLGERRRGTQSEWELEACRHQSVAEDIGEDLF